MDVDRTTLAQLRLLVATARSLGAFTAEEEAALRTLLQVRPAAFGAVVKPDPDLDTELLLLSDDERRILHQSTFALAHPLGHTDLPLVSAIAVDPGDEGTLHALFTPGPAPLRAARPVDNLFDDLLVASCLAAVAASLPFPQWSIRADVAVGAVHRHVWHRFRNHDGPLVGAGSPGLRMAIGHLARFTRGWGTVASATTAFVTTWAIGYAAHAAPDAPQTDTERAFQEGWNRGRAAHRQKLAEVEARREDWARPVEALADRYLRAELSRAQYESAVLALAT